MRATFGISANIGVRSFYRQLRIVSIQVNKGPLAYPYEFPITKSEAVLSVSVRFASAYPDVPLVPRQLVGTPRVICPLISGQVTGYAVYNPHWYNDTTLEFLAYSYTILEGESGIIQFQQLIGSDGVTRWVNPAIA